MLYSREKSLGVKSGSFSKMGASKSEFPKENQDAHLACINLNLNLEWQQKEMGYNKIAKSMERESLESLEGGTIGGVHLFGVFDGHGKAGRHVSEFIKNRFPKILKSLSK